MLRIVPCLGESNNVGVFCAIIKLVKGTGKELVEGYGDIAQAKPTAMSEAGVEQVNQVKAACEKRGTREWDDYEIQRNVLTTMVTVRNEVPIEKGHQIKAECAIRKSLALMKRKLDGAKNFNHPYTNADKAISCISIGSAGSRLMPYHDI